MEIAVYNPGKGHHETIRIEFDPENTTWFDEDSSSEGIYSITDVNGDLLIRESGYSIPLLITELTRSAINCDQRKAKELIKQHQ